MSEFDQQLNAAALALDRSRIVVTICHRRPDGDTVGSALALAAALEAAGKTVHCFCVDAPPDALTLFMGKRRFISDEAVFAVADTVVVLDSGDLRFTAVQTALVALSPPPAIINIDHHAVNERFGTINLVAVGASSTTQVIFMLLKTLRWAVTPETATDILIGIVTDTPTLRVFQRRSWPTKRRFCRRATTQLTVFQIFSTITWRRAPFSCCASWLAAWSKAACARLVMTSTFASRRSNTAAADTAKRRDLPLKERSWKGRMSGRWRSTN